MTNAITDIKKEKEILLKLTETECGILEQIRKNPFITQKELAAAMGVSHAGIRYAMKGLKDKGLVVRIGSNRSGKWRLKDKTIVCCINESVTRQCH